MNPRFNCDLPAILAERWPLVVELGCGPNARPDRLNIDILDLPGVDIVADLERGLPFLPDNSVDDIHSKSFLEHIDALELLMGEIWRVLKPGGRKHLFVPHFSNPYTYSDYTHRRFFGLYSFDYFCKEPGRFRRRVPAFYHDFSFRVEEIELVFNSPWPFRRRFKRALGRLVNLSPWWQEFYEENLCAILPCYGIRAVLSPVK